ncbi:MAG TPA: sulfur carrier protein ThiS [Candidatus Sumerlaeota bacterium]|nr:MAG: bifunctional sulfur carrier protein/thiazole synthase protein [candidate division BRC1 bacterium ADurb.Bin183]HOE64072.1 sulfur carrier protein ThiS [Candidatus Sumerlaeota bacterium]HRR31131.1 sulfur carrier protein ThiS [Candidatus Sumerlaeia bacterium]HON49015.1 sulfur carrier protein ThiS [Candidatus Sumerlaeota bacterium]HOR64377.1 sulfur carrier protein ThiS [Candidatus Sumerlaeota bacterium]
MATITINGERRNWEGEKTLRELIQSLNLKTENLLIEQNFEIVPANQLDERMARAGDVIEIIRIVGGG